MDQSVIVDFLPYNASTVLQVQSANTHTQTQHPRQSPAVPGSRSCQGTGNSVGANCKNTEHIKKHTAQHKKEHHNSRFNSSKPSNPSMWIRHKASSRIVLTSYRIEISIKRSKRDASKVPSGRNETCPDEVKRERASSKSERTIDVAASAIRFSQQTGRKTSHYYST